MGQHQIRGQFGIIPPGSFSTVMSGTAGTDNSSVGTLTWSSPGNVAVPGAKAQVGTGTNWQSHYLDVTGFGFALPASATVTGVAVGFTAGGSGVAGPEIASVKLIKAGAVVGTEHAPGGTSLSSGAAVPLTYGADGDLWGVTLASTDVNNAGFGVAISAADPFVGGAVAVFCPVKITIFYTRPATAGANALADTASSADGWTTGATTILNLPQQPDIQSSWEVLSWGMSYVGQLAQPSAAVPSFGLLGQLWGGVMLNSQSNTQNGVSPWVTPMLPFPADLSSFALIYDGTQSPPYPWVDVGPTPRYTSYVNGLQQPIKMQPGDQISLGLWLTPALVQNVQTLITLANYAVTYEDGLN